MAEACFGIYANTNIINMHSRFRVDNYLPNTVRTVYILAFSLSHLSNWLSCGTFSFHSFTSSWTTNRAQNWRSSLTVCQHLPAVPSLEHLCLLAVHTLSTSGGATPSPSPSSQLDLSELSTDMLDSLETVRFLFPPCNAIESKGIQCATASDKLDAALMAQHIALESMGTIV
jgi:hypothetical protein